MDIARIVINSASLLVIAVLCATAKLRRNKIAKEFGSVQVKFASNRKAVLLASVLVISVALIVSQYFRAFQFYIMIVLDAVAVLAVEISVKDYILQKSAGVYENALIADGKILQKGDIVALPTLEYEESDEYKKEKENDEFSQDALDVSMKSLKIVTEKNGEIYIGFASAEERAKAVDIIRKWL